MVYRLTLMLIIYLLFVKSVTAVTTTIANVPETITTEPFTLRITISGAVAGTNYLRLDLYKLSSTNYFGETFNGLEWYFDSDHTRYYPINIESAKDWSGDIQGKVGSPNNVQYDGAGIYKLRVRRYTSSGNYSSTEANNSATDVNLSIPATISPPADPPSSTIENNEQLISPTAFLQRYNNLFLSEVMIDPDAGNNEWVELYNANTYEVVLENWFVDDAENSGSTPKKFSLIIPANSYSSLDFTGSIFNNGGDSVRLLDFNQQEIDSFQYESVEKNKTIGRISFDNDNFCLQNPTKNNPNNPCLSPTSSPNKDSPTATAIATITKALQLPTTSSVSSAINTPFKFPLFQQKPIPQNQEDKVTEVLGINIENAPINSVKNQALISSLTFASFSYSILSIISILIKIKNVF